VQPTLPVAISFFTFMAISYVVDVYRGRIDTARPVDLAVYLCFFPHLIAGPIVRGEELLPQIRRRRDPAEVDFSRAVWMIMAGLFKKVVISSYVSTAIVTAGLLGTGRALGPRGRSSPPGATRCRSTATSAATPTSRSGWPSCSASGSR
jgi:hypothetical protein